MYLSNVQSVKNLLESILQIVAIYSPSIFRVLLVPFHSKPCFLQSRSRKPSVLTTFILALPLFTTALPPLPLLKRLAHPRRNIKRLHLHPSDSTVVSLAVLGGSRVIIDNLVLPIFLAALPVVSISISLQGRQRHRRLLLHLHLLLLRRVLRGRLVPNLLLLLRRLRWQAVVLLLLVALRIEWLVLCVAAVGHGSEGASRRDAARPDGGLGFFHEVGEREAETAGVRAGVGFHVVGAVEAEGAACGPKASERKRQFRSISTKQKRSRSTPKTHPQRDTKTG